jgi:hypothetical protein
MTRYFFRSEYGIRLTVMFFIPWDALSDERTGLSFVCAAGTTKAGFKPAVQVYGQYNSQLLLRYETFQL